MLRHVLDPTAGTHDSQEPRSSASSVFDVPPRSDSTISRTATTSPGPHASETGNSSPSHEIDVAKLQDLRLNSGGSSPHPSTSVIPVASSDSSDKCNIASNKSNNVHNDSIQPIPVSRSTTATTPTKGTSYQRKFLVDKMAIISGGTGANSITGAFTTLSKQCSFVLPVSDDGGSSSEIIRVLGGPSIGDIRSRLIRLIPHNTGDKSGLRQGGTFEQFDHEANQSRAIARLLAHRLTGSTAEVKTEWSSIVEGRHPLWRGISQERKECIRAFLVHFEYTILQRARKRFSFKNCSVGNAYLSGALLFLRNIESAIYLFTTMTAISPDHRCVPVINTTSVATIGAELEDGDIIVGQCQISHPSPSSSSTSGNKRRGSINSTFKSDRYGKKISQLSVNTSKSSVGRLHAGPFGGGAGDDDLHGHDVVEFDDQLDDDPYQQSSPIDEGNVIFMKDSRPQRSTTEGLAAPPSSSLGAITDDEFTSDLETEQTPQKSAVASGEKSVSNPSNSPLQSKVKRIFYINAYGQEVFPKPNPRYMSDLSSASVLIYSCGSLFTSIIPCLSLRGVSSGIRNSQSLKYKILLLNGTYDRETPKFLYSKASDFINAIHQALLMTELDESQRSPNPSDADTLDDLYTLYPANNFITHVLYIEDGEVEVDKEVLDEMNIKYLAVRTVKENGKAIFEESAILDALSLVLSN